MVIGIATSTRTPYVIGGLKYARSIGDSTASISCNENAIISQYCDIYFKYDFNSFHDLYGKGIFQFAGRHGSKCYFISASKW